MSLLPLTLAAIAVMALAAFLIGKQRALAAAGDQISSLHSRPSYHGLFAALCVALTGYGVFVLVDLIGLWIVNGRMSALALELAPAALEIERELMIADAIAIARDGVPSKIDKLRELLALRFAEWDGLRIWSVLGLSLAAAGAAFAITVSKINQFFRARNRSEQIIRGMLWASATIAILTTVGIVLSLIGETLAFFESLAWRVDAFLFGTTWSPLSGVHDGNLSADKVGAIPLFAGTLMVTVIAMLVAVPIGLFAAIYLADFASPRTRSWAKPLLEVLAGIPTVVYGFFAAITVAPALRDFGDLIGLSIASESALAAGVVMGIMIIPFISSLSDDVINSVPQSLRDGSYGLGATKAETVRQVVLPAALPGIVSAVLLGISRAVGETMIVVMAAGQGANLTWNPLEAVTTVTVQIVMLITGDTEASTAAGPAFTLGFTLFCVTLTLNMIALKIVRRYRELYD